jgi:hypothetical protein
MVFIDFDFDIKEKIIFSFILENKEERVGW